MAITLASGPAAEPITTTEAKTHMRVDTSDDDTYITALITAARKYLVEVTGKPFVYELYDERFTEFPSDKSSIPLQRGPVVSITSVKYVDSAGSTGTFASTSWHAETAPVPGRVTLDYGASWPTTILEPGHSVIVRYRAGYASGVTGVPEDRKQLVRAMVAHWYEHREPILTGTVQAKVPDHLGALIMQDRIWPL